MAKCLQNQQNTSIDSTSSICQFAPWLSDLHFSAAKVADFFLLLCQRIQNFVTLRLDIWPTEKMHRTCRHPQSSHQELFVWQVPKNVVLVAVLIITRKPLKHRREHCMQLQRAWGGTAKEWITLKSLSHSLLSCCGAWARRLVLREAHFPARRTPAEEHVSPWSAHPASLRQPLSSGELAHIFALCSHTFERVSRY